LHTNRQMRVCRLNVIIQHSDSLVDVVHVCYLIHSTTYLEARECQSLGTIFTFMRVIGGEVLSLVDLPCLTAEFLESLLNRYSTL